MTQPRNSHRPTPGETTSFRISSGIGQRRGRCGAAAGIVDRDAMTSRRANSDMQRRGGGSICRRYDAPCPPEIGC
eukprot:6644361-Pyramimonas_sp.AAC.1